MVSFTGGSVTEPRHDGRRGVRARENKIESVRREPQTDLDQIAAGLAGSPPAKEGSMNMEGSRRGFLKVAGVGAAGTALGALGFGAAEAAEVAHVRAYKLAATTETRNTCPYCSVACGIILYSKGDLRKGETADITHIEGDVDHPTNRGTLCPKGAALKDFVHSKSRLSYPMVRKPGSDKF